MSDLNYGEGREYGGKLKAFPLLHGRQIYNMYSFTTLSRNPVEDLESFITAGAQAGDDPVLDVDETALTALLEGGIVVIDPDNANVRRLMDYCYCRDANTILKYLPDRNGNIELCMLRGSRNMDIAYSKGGNMQWTRKLARVSAGGGSYQTVEPEDYALMEVVEQEQIGEYWMPEYLDSQGQPVKDDFWKKEYKPLPASKFKAFPNGRGPLYWAQNPLFRLEEIAETMRRVMSGPNLLPILSGPGIGRQSEVRNTFRNAEYAMVFSTDLKVDRPISTSGIQQLTTEDDLHQARFYAALKLVPQDTKTHQLASDGALRMASMVKFIRRTQEFIQKVFKELGGDVAFDTIVTKTADERTKDFELLLRMKELGYIEDEEMRRRVKMLRGV